MKLGCNLMFRVDNNSAWEEGRSKDSRQSSSRKHVQKRVEFAQRALFGSVVFFFRGTERSMLKLMLHICRMARIIVITSA